MENFKIENEVTPSKKKRKWIRWGARSLNWERINKNQKNPTLSLIFGWIKHEKTLLKANKIQIIGKKIDKAILKKNIKIEDKTNQVLLRSGFGIYEKEKSIIRIEKFPRFYSTNKKKSFFCKFTPYCS